MEGRISATGLKSVELDELKTNQIIKKMKDYNININVIFYYQQ